MQTKKCKYCNKEINVKAEICPHCGCRVKSNTLKFIIICLAVIIAVVLGFYVAHKTINAIKDSIKSKEEKIVNEKETKLLNSFIGTYQLSYNKELVDQDFNKFDFIKDITFDKKCYVVAMGDKAEQEIVEGECICAVDFETIRRYSTGISSTYYIYKIDDNNAILSFQFSNIAKYDNYDEYMNYKVCFEKDNDNNLIQTKCTKPRNSYSSYDDNKELDLKYEFKLTKVS